MNLNILGGFPRNFGDSYLDSMGYNRTSTLYANSSGPCISTIRPTAAWSTPDESLNPGFLEVDEVFLEVSLPVDDVGSGTRMLHLMRKIKEELGRCSGIYS